MNTVNLFNSDTKIQSNIFQSEKLGQSEVSLAQDCVDTEFQSLLGVIMAGVVLQNNSTQLPVKNSFIGFTDSPVKIVSIPQEISELVKFKPEINNNETSPNLSKMIDNKNDINNTISDKKTELPTFTNKKIDSSNKPEKLNYNENVSSIFVSSNEVSSQNIDTRQNNAQKLLYSDNNKNEEPKVFIDENKSNEDVLLNIPEKLSLNKTKSDSIGHSVKNNILVLSEKSELSAIVEAQETKKIVSMQEPTSQADINLRKDSDSFSFALNPETPTKSVSEISNKSFKNIESIYDVKDFSINIIKKDANHIEVMFEPKGIGKLDMNLSLDNGVLNARITAIETVTKEFLDKNMTFIVDALSKEGINIGSFTVSSNADYRKDSFGQNQNNKSDKNSESYDSCSVSETIITQTSFNDDRVISIFV